MALAPGLYEQLLTRELADALQDQPYRTEEPSPGLSTELLLDQVTRQLAGALESLGDGAPGSEAQLALVASLLVRLRRLVRARDGRNLDTAEVLLRPARVLRQVGAAPLQHPETGLLQPWLFAAGKATPSLLHELRRELSSCEGVDILVSFITVSGVRKVIDVLRGAASAEPGLRIRVLTTTYTGATEAPAIDELARLPGCEVRISLDGRRTRLHAKAWIFSRASGFGSAYIGSANLSGAAMTGGLEWTVKVTQRGQSALYATAQAHFETLWADPEFERYDPACTDHRQALLSALRRQEGQVETGTVARFFDLQPKSFQQVLLDQLAAERMLGRHRLLLVAATGTGKTVVAAFDYRRLCDQAGGKRPRLLFVAHRQEILRQAQRTFREVLRDPEFGTLLSGGKQPERFDHLFATIDSVAARDLVGQFGADHWTVVIIDECHRLAAQRFDAFATGVRPRELLGLTATPERSDGRPIAAYFDMRPDGAPAAELRLWQALDLQLLAPFEYYGCDDETDFSNVPWDQPGEREALERLVAANESRALLVLREWDRLAGGMARGKALAFCVSVAHACFMAAAFHRAGVPAACVTGDTPDEERRRAPALLESGHLKVLVTVDLYNEGVDLPFVRHVAAAAADTECGGLSTADRPWLAVAPAQGELPRPRFRRPAPCELPAGSPARCPHRLEPPRLAHRR